MKFKSEKKQLLEAVKAAGLAVTSVSLPIDQHIRISLKGKELTVVGSDPSLTIQTVLPVDGEEDGEICLPSKAIMDVTTALNQHPKVSVVSISDEKEIELDSETDDEESVASAGNKVSIFGDKGGSFTLHQLSAGNFISLTIDKDAAKTKLNAQDFITSLKQVVDMASKTPSRPVLNGILIEVEEKGSTKLVASDTFRLGIKDLGGKALSGIESVLIPANSINKLISLVDDAEEIIFSVENNQAGFEFKDTTVVTQLLSGDFPDYRKLLVEDNPDTLEIKKEDLDTALGQVVVMAKEDANQLIKADLKKDQIELSADDKNRGSASVTVKASYDGEEMSIGLNAVYLRDILKSLEDDTFVAKLNGPLKPLFIHGKEAKTFQCLLMPVRLNS